MGNWVIVAIPEKNDKVWKISSEKVPHLTILSLGEHEAGPDSAKILSYMEHAVHTMLHKFHMSVNDRGELGPKDADVLFFEKGWHGAEIIKFRDALLKEPTISEWFKGSDQFPEWTPHITLGFPQTPANEDDSEYPDIHGVFFDRIALWTGDYDGPEVKLKSYQDMYESTPELVQAMSMIDSELAMIASQRAITNDDIVHFGKKGMKWGVRNDSSGASVSNALTKKSPEIGKVRISSTPGSNMGEVNAVARQQKQVNKDLKNSIEPFNKAYFEKHPPKSGQKMNPVELDAYHYAFVTSGVNTITKALSKPPPKRSAVSLAFGPSGSKKELVARFGLSAAAATALVLSHVDTAPDAFVLLINLDDDGIVDSAEAKLPSIKHDSVGDVLRLDQKVSDIDLTHFGKKGMKWGVRRDERALGAKDVALNISQRSQVKVASSISALAAIGMSTNAAATLFQLQNRFERLQGVNAILDQAQSNPLIDEASREALRRTKSNVIKGIVGSAMATTAVSLAIGVVTQRTATAYFAPMHKVYGTAKPKINGDLKKLSKDIKTGKRDKLTVKDYNTEVASIVRKRMTEDQNNLLKPFHELARSQLGLQYNTKSLDVKFSKLPNTDLMSKMTVTTPSGLVLVKAIKNVEHADNKSSPETFDFYFDYKFDSDGHISDFSCPTMEVLQEIVEGRFDMTSIASRFEAPYRFTEPELIDDVLVQSLESTDSDIQHADRNIGQVLDSMDPEDRDIFDTIVGSAVEGDGLGEVPAYLEFYDTLTQLEKAILAFVVGSALSEDVALEQSAMDGEHLSHYGKKGMKWGIRKERSGSAGARAFGSGDRASARAKVQAGVATLGETHIAAMKSTGHRVVNGVLGDKTHWKRAAVIAGVSAAGVGAAFAAPALLPAGTLVGIAKLSGATIVGGQVLISGVGGAASTAGVGTSVAVGGSSLTAVSATTVGAAMLTGALTTAATVGGAAAGVGNYANNAYRAVTGNAKVNRSYTNLGNAAALRQTQGTKAIQKSLSRNGSLKKRDLRQAMEDGDFFSLDQKVSDMDLAQSVSMHLSHILDASNTDEIIDYLAHHEMELYDLTTDETISDDDIIHFGKKGMKWGVRRVRTASGRVGTEVLSVTNRAGKATGRLAVGAGKATGKAAGRAAVKGGKAAGRSAVYAVRGKPIPTDVKEVSGFKRAVKKRNTNALSNEELERLTKRIQLENSYREASTKSSTLTKNHSKVKTALDLGQTANRAVQFATSDAGILLASTITGKDPAKLRAAQSLKLGKPKEEKKKKKDNV